MVQPCVPHFAFSSVEGSQVSAVLIPTVADGNPNSYPGH